VPDLRGYFIRGADDHQATDPAKVDATPHARLVAHNRHCYRNIATMPPILGSRAVFLFPKMASFYIEPGELSQLVEICRPMLERSGPLAQNGIHINYIQAATAPWMQWRPTVKLETSQIQWAKAT
jgi:hypothetical protein